jgi:enoyl-CoA hydratase/carnithine racemase
VAGYCIGAAFEMALACDLRVAHPQVQFGLPEVKLGIPSVVDAALLQQFVGLSKAKEIILTGDMYPLADFAHTGIANRIVDPSELHATALDLANQLGSYTPQVMAAQKGLFETWLNYGLQHGIDTSVDVFADLFAHPATVQAIAKYQPPRGADRAQHRSCGSRIRTTTWPVCGVAPSHFDLVFRKVLRARFIEIGYLTTLNLITPPIQGSGRLR